MAEKSNTSGSSGKRVSPVQMQKHLKGVSYPASKSDLVKQAQTNHASDDILAKIRTLPADSFGGPKDVMKALGQTE